MGRRLSRKERRREARENARNHRRGRRGRYEARRRGRHRRYYEARDAGPSVSRPAPAGIPSQRTIEIQNALIKAGYLDGPPSGQYDESTTAAMKQFQADNGISKTGLPSAHSLKKLGVAKGSNDGYAVPVKSKVEQEKKPAAPDLDAVKPKF